MSARTWSAQAYCRTSNNSAPSFPAGSLPNKKSRTCNFPPQYKPPLPLICQHDPLNARFPGSQPLLYSCKVGHLQPIYLCLSSTSTSIPSVSAGLSSCHSVSLNLCLAGTQSAWHFCLPGTFVCLALCLPGTLSRSYSICLALCLPGTLSAWHSGSQAT